jgi:hypothetical protein
MKLRNKETRTMAKKNNTPLATDASDDNTGMITEVDTSTNPSCALDETFDARVPIVRSPIIAYIIKLCKFPEDSTKEYIDQQGWTELIHVPNIGSDEVNDFHTVRYDGIRNSTKPKLIHL